MSPFRRSLCLLLLATACALRVSAAAPAGWLERAGVRDLSGRPVASSARWFAVVFLSPDCPLANNAVPILNQLARDFAGQPVAVIGAYVDGDLELPALRAHAKAYGLTFLAVDDRAHHLVALAHATYTPQAAVFSADGILLYRGRIDDRVGEIAAERPAATTHDLHDVLAALVAGEAGPFPDRSGFGCAIPQSLKR